MNIQFLIWKLEYDGVQCISLILWYNYNKNIYQASWDMRSQITHAEISKHFYKTWIFVIFSNIYAICNKCASAVLFDSKIEFLLYRCWLLNHHPESIHQTFNFRIQHLLALFSCHNCFLFLHTAIPFFSFVVSQNNKKLKSKFYVPLKTLFR